MRILAIGGFGSGSGKTTLVACALSRLPGWGALKTSPGKHGRAGSGGWALDTGSAALRVAGTDTARMFAAGAARVAWLRSEGSPPAPALDAVREWSAGLPGLVVEGLRAAEALGAQRLYLVARAGSRDLKPAAFEAMPRAAAVVVNGSAIPGEIRGARVVVADLSRADDPALAALLDEISAWSRS